MGTRNLFTIIKNDKTVLAKYNQWDGYLDGQGKQLSDFIENDLSFETLNNGISRIKLLDSEKDQAVLDSIYERLNATRYDDESRSMLFPLITRDTNIRQQLQAISIGVGPLESVDASEFQNDGLFCEYAYTLNLDENTVSVFRSGAEKCDKLLLKCDILQYPDKLDELIKTQGA
jgi:hypothetical protein